MFTGIIEHVGRVVRCGRSARGGTLSVDLGPLAADAAVGDSIAIDGLCLTIAARTGTVADFDVSAETLRRSTLAGWRMGRSVNLERALTLATRLGGHLVAGHVDGIGRLLGRRQVGEGEELTLLLPADGSMKVVEKGSVAIDGVSLTSYACRGLRFTVAVVPHTLRASTIGSWRPGRRVHLEQDPIGRWVERLLAERSR
jgi:riboflavin synthase